jgi:hypothetical protein
VIKCRRVRQAEHVARMEKKSASRVWCEDLKERRHLGDLGTCKMDLKEVGCEGVEQI